MKRLFVLSLVAVLSVGVLSFGALAASDSDTTNVHWYYSGCQISVVAHNPVDLGGGNNISGAPQTVESAGNNVDVTSGCPYTLVVETTGFESPIGDDIYESFFVKVQQDTSLNTDFSGSKINNAYKSFYHDLSGAAVTVAEEVPGEGNTDRFKMDYRYDFELDDQQGNYRVDLMYTASTN